MRNSCIIKSSHFISSNNNCPDSPVHDQTLIDYKCDCGSGTHSFKHCSWDNSPRSSNGGAIHYVLTAQTKQTSASLTVENCVFLHCHETGTIAGGAIYTNYIGSASISDSYFYDCECGSSTDGPDGAGVLLNHLHTLPLIKSCSFVSCVSGDDGGGCGIWNCGSFLNYALDSCSFIKCKGTDIESAQGGAVIFYNNTGARACTNCIFSNSEGYYGGALYLHCFSYLTSTPPASFCFFNKNSVLTSGYGNDVGIENCLVSNASVLFQHCVSTSNPNRIGYSYITWSWKNTDVNWLPHATINITLAALESGINTKCAPIFTSPLRTPVLLLLPESLTQPIPSTASSVLVSLKEQDSLSLLLILLSLSA